MRVRKCSRRVAHVKWSSSSESTPVAGSAGGSTLTAVVGRCVVGVPDAVGISVIVSVSGPSPTSLGSSGGSSASCFRPRSDPPINLDSGPSPTNARSSGGESAALLMPWGAVIVWPARLRARGICPERPSPLVAPRVAVPLKLLLSRDLLLGWDLWPGLAEEQCLVEELLGGMIPLFLCGPDPAWPILSDALFILALPSLD